MQAGSEPPLVELPAVRLCMELLRQARKILRVARAALERLEVGPAETHLAQSLVVLAAAASILLRLLMLGVALFTAVAAAEPVDLITARRRLLLLQRVVHRIVLWLAAAAPLAAVVLRPLPARLEYQVTQPEAARAAAAAGQLLQLQLMARLAVLAV